MAAEQPGRAEAKPVEAMRERPAPSSGLDDRNQSAAAFLAAAIGIATMGLLQFIAELNESFNEFLAFSSTLGPYSGKYVFAYSAWLVSWAILYPIARGGRISIRTALIISGILIFAGAVLLFPPFIGLFTGE